MVARRVDLAVVVPRYPNWVLAEFGAVTVDRVWVREEHLGVVRHGFVADGAVGDWVFGRFVHDIKDAALGYVCVDRGFGCDGAADRGVPDSVVDYVGDKERGRQGLRVCRMGRCP